MNKTEREIARTCLDEIEKRFQNLENAYIHLRHAYRNALGIKVRDVSYNMSMTANTSGDLKPNTGSDGKTEHLSAMTHHELYIEAERLARIAKVPSDV